MSYFSSNTLFKTRPNRGSRLHAKLGVCYHNEECNFLPRLAICIGFTFILAS
jgi:hypothetical protein